MGAKTCVSEIDGCHGTRGTRANDAPAIYLTALFSGLWTSILISSLLSLLFLDGTESSRSLPWLNNATLPFPFVPEMQLFLPRKGKLVLRLR